VWWQRKNRFHPRSCFAVTRPLASGRNRYVSFVFNANISTAGGGGTTVLRRFFATFFVVVLGFVVGPVAAGAVVDGVAPAPTGVGNTGACPRATPPTQTSIIQATAARDIRLSLFATGPTVKL